MANNYLALSFILFMRNYHLFYDRLFKQDKYQNKGISKTPIIQYKINLSKILNHTKKI